MQELIIDNFAGGGGASTGIEIAIGRSVDVAINHDPEAIAMHEANHPETKHYCESVWEVDPREAASGQPVGLVWLSPDCKHFSKAKGGKPVQKNVRGLAWVAVRWAATVKPRVIMLENVEEFKTWGPLLKDGYPDPKQKGRTFNCFVNALRRLGYKVDWRELRACDYGAPTIRKRLFLAARCDGRPIEWPEPTHGDPESEAVKSGRLLPWRTAAEIIDWSIPCPSIFERKRPLAENTLRRIARGIQRFVLDAERPFIAPFIARIGQTGFGGDRMQYELADPLTTITTKAEHLLVAPLLAGVGGRAGQSRPRAGNEPMATITTKADTALICPTLIQMGYGERQGQEPRVLDLGKPVGTVTAGGNKFALTAAFLAKHFGGNYTGAGADLEEPVPTVTTKDHNALVSSHLVKLRGTCADGQPVTGPMPTITAGGLHVGEVRAFLLKYYGSADNGQRLTDPLHTVTTKDRFGLVTIEGVDYQIVDIGMRMLEPHELFAAQGFPASYIIDKYANGKAVPKSAQVARCGNSVCPPLATALVRANLPELCVGSGKVLAFERYATDEPGQMALSL
ncbi:DNA cytosine methyltransferase [Paenibacillus sp. P22]|uniref:DNA cytosine methyltransferase n=1 Tax=Paenibacillus sp. P22 TaxID=483908 RepID=UPI0004337A4A|nr:DNA cytosine methyltransferase [Paenibacillus sp. P22]CDN44013.1 C-5 cytosine-specific DNA methylase [Paenibacillus sp. P22]